jgi:hypothetical protein
VYTNGDFLTGLDALIKARSEELTQLSNQKEQLEAKITRLTEWLRQAEALRDAELKQRGITVPPTPSTGHYQFIGMTARQAYRAVLRERKKASKTELIEALKAGGFQFGDKSPRRVLQFAMIGDPHVKKLEEDSYEWQEETERDTRDVTLPGFSS